MQNYFKLHKSKTFIVACHLRLEDLTVKLKLFGATIAALMNTLRPLAGAFGSAFLALAKGKEVAI
jgi:hypothetical protein